MRGTVVGAWEGTRYHPYLLSAWRSDRNKSLDRKVDLELGAVTVQESLVRFSVVVGRLSIFQDSLGNLCQANYRAPAAGGDGSVRNLVKDPRSALQSSVAYMIVLSVDSSTLCSIYLHTTLLPIRLTHTVYWNLEASGKAVYVTNGFLSFATIR